MTERTKDPGPGRGPSFGAGGTAAHNPVGLLHGDPARAAIARGLALPIAGGAVAFNAAERLAIEDDGHVATTILPIADLPEAVRTAICRPRPPFAGVDLGWPVLMGVVNVTPDSFSDGGEHADPAAAIAHMFALSEAGAAIVDIGGESTRPGADPVSVADELGRVMPVIEAGVAAGLTLSVDTRRAEVMRAAIAAGAAIVNDVTALSGDPEALATVAETGAAVVLMHMRGLPRTMQVAPSYNLASLDIFSWLAGRLQACETAGIPRARMVVDPGIGFGKTDAHNSEILNRLGLFHGLGCGVMVGVSRKSFVGRIANVSDPKDRVPGTIAATVIAVERGVQLHRVHDVAEIRQALAICAAVYDGA